MSKTREFIENFSETNPLPHVVTTLNNLITDPESTMKDFEEVIKMDQVLVSRLLRLVNSPFYGLAQKVDSIGRAVAFLGMKNLHNLVVVDAMRKIFTTEDRSPHFSQMQLWMHSATVAISAKMVAERIFGINGDDGFLCGILHDFGLLVEKQVAPAEFDEICTTCTSTSQLIELEQRAFGTDHCEICYHLTMDWNMPPTVQEAIRHHHQFMDDVDPGSLTGIIQIAEYLAGGLEYSTLPSVTVDISHPLLHHLEELEDEYTVLIDDLPEELAKAQAVYG